MTIVPINFVTSDGSRWGAGLSRVLNPPEIDRNFWELASAVAELAANPLEPVEIAAFGISGVGMTITMSNGSTVGPLPLPVLSWRWRDEWVPSVPYAMLDVFMVEGSGIFLVLQDHVSDVTFDPNALLSGSLPLYQQLFGTSSTGGAVNNGLAAGCDEDWGLIGSPISATADWGMIGEPITLQIDMGLIGA